MKSYATRKWEAGQAARDAAQAERYARQAASAPIDYDAVEREQASLQAAREAYSNRDMTEENALADIAKEKSRFELARILSLAGVSTWEDLMGSVPWASTYLPLERGDDLVIFTSNGETRGVWDKFQKVWNWSDQNNRGNRDDVGSGYGRHAD